MDQTQQGPQSGDDGPEDDEPPQPVGRFVRNLLGAFGRQASQQDDPGRSPSGDAQPKPGLLNLRRMAVEDVARG